MGKTFSKVFAACMAGMIAISSPIASQGFFHQSIAEVEAAETTIDTSWYDNNPDATTFEIHTAAEFRGIAQLVYNPETKEKTTDFAGCTIKLMDNIDLENENYTPVGTMKTSKTSNGKVTQGIAFRGFLDGNNKVLSNLYIDKSSAATRMFAGLFGVIEGITGQSGTIEQVQGQAGVKDLTIKDVIINTSTTAANPSDGGTGSIVGYGTSMTIENCHVLNATINNVYQYSGGLFGCIEGGTVKNSSVKSTSIMSSASISYAGLLGGGVWKNSSTSVSSQNNEINNVTAQGTVTGNQYTGGLLGVDNDSTGSARLENSVVETDSKVSGTNYVGGIIGSNRNTIKNCRNYAEVSGTGNDISGIAPLKAKTASYEECINYGDVTGVGYVAGIASAKTAPSGATAININQCFNAGNVKTTDADSKAEAIACLGKAGIFNISNSYNVGEVKNSDGDIEQFTSNNQYTNVYYNSEFGTADGAAIEGLTPATTAQFKDRTVVDGLNTGLDTPVWYQNTDYPDFASNMTLVEELAVPEKMEIAVGKTEEINASVTPADATNPTIAYEVKDEAIATVDNKGIVTAVKGGNTEITVKALDSGLSKTVAVTVTVPVTDINVQIDKAELEIGQTAQITSTVAPEDATDKAVTYTSGDDKIATVDDKGVVTAVAAGTVKITVKSGDVTKDISVTVKAKEEPATPTEPTNPSEQPTTPSEQPTTPSEQPTTPSEQPTKKEISSLTIQAVGNKTYTGKAITPSVTVKDGNKVLAAGTDYTLAYSNNKNVGTAKIIITGKGNYAGTATVSFKIVAAKGKSYYSGTNRYKVTNASATKGTVAYTGTKNKKATKLTIPATVKIGSVTYKVTSVAGNAFKNNKKLKTVVIGSNVTSIGTAAFYKCKALTSVTIGKNVKTIGSKAFYGCSKLKKITVKSTKLTKVGSKALSGIHKKAVIKVPSKKLKAYQKLFKNKGQKKTVKIKK